MNVSWGHQIRLFKNCFKLLTRYYIKGFLALFYLVFFPLVILVMQKVIFDSVPEPNTRISTIFLGTLISQIIIMGFFIIPNTIIDFRNSIIIKHFGSMNMNPRTFFLAVISFGGILSVLTLAITSTWTLLIFVKHPVEDILYGINFISVLYIFLLIIIAITFGVFLATFIKTNKQHTIIANMLFLPIALLSGVYLPMHLIEKNFFTNFLSYISIFKYPAMLLLDPTQIKFKVLNSDWLFSTYLVVSTILPIVFIAISIKWWKWYD